METTTEPLVTPEELTERARIAESNRESLSMDEVSRRGWAFYYQKRAELETEANVGKLITFDVTTGNYEIRPPTDVIVGPTLLWRRNPSAILYTLRVGYRTAFTRRGNMTRLPPLVPEANPV